MVALGKFISFKDPIPVDKKFCGWIGKLIWDFRHLVHHWRWIEFNFFLEGIHRLKRVTVSHNVTMLHLAWPTKKSHSIFIPYSYSFQTNHFYTIYIELIVSEGQQRGKFCIAEEATLRAPAWRGEIHLDTSCCDCSQTNDGTMQIKAPIFEGDESKH